MIVLNAVEARALGCLIEKEITTPEYYPLSLNATLNACNQKSSREPVMALGESEVRSALFELEGMGLVRNDAQGRVSKFEHRVRDVLNLRRDEVAVLCLLLVRGPQTSAELRSRSDRMYSFEDNAATLATLERMASREEPLTVLLPKLPGAREARWAHLLAGPVEHGAVGEPSQTPALAGDGSARRDASATRDALEARVDELEVRVAVLEERLQRMEAGPAPEAAHS